MTQLRDFDGSPGDFSGNPWKAHVQGVAVHEFVDVIRGLTTEPRTSLENMEI
jgi:hypothetical protein